MTTPFVAEPLDGTPATSDRPVVAPSSAVAHWPASAPRLLTPKQAAEYSQTSTSSIVRLITAGRLRASNYATGNQRAKWRIDPADLARVDPPVSEHVRQPTPPPRQRRHGQSASAAVQSYLPLA